MDKQDKTSFWAKLRSSAAPEADGGDGRLFRLADESYEGPGLPMILRLAVAAAFVLVTTLLTLADSVSLLVLIAAALVAGYDLVLSAWNGIRARALLQEDLLIVAASVISFCTAQPLQGALAPLILQLAFILRDYVQAGMKRSLADVIDPADSGDWSDADITPGSAVRVEAGRIFPADCVVTEGSAYADLSTLTGDAALRELRPGSFAPAGGECADGEVTVQIISEPEASLSAKYAAALRKGALEPTAAEKKWTRLTKPLVPAALMLGVILLVALPLSGAATLTAAFHRVAAIMAVAAPGSVLLTIPSAWYVGIAAARKSGAVVLGADTLEKLSDSRAVVFGKSGTLTEKNYMVASIKTTKMDPATFLKVAAHAEARSSSQAAQAIVAAYGGKIDDALVQNFRETPGGVLVTVDGIPIVLGTRSLLRQAGLAIPDGNYSATAVHMCVSGIYAGHIDLSETVSRDAVETVHELSRCGVERVAMVTGDGREPSRLVASELAIDEYYAECPPAEQGKKITDMKARLAPNSTLVFVGCPDSPDEAFRAADAGIEIDALALGNGLRPADVFVLGESTAPVVPTIAAARAAKRCASISALAAAGAKALLIILAAVGVAPLWFTLVVDACVSNGLVVSALSLAAEKKPKDE